MQHEACIVKPTPQTALELGLSSRSSKGRSFVGPAAEIVIGQKSRMGFSGDEMSGKGERFGVGGTLEEAARRGRKD